MCREKDDLLHSKMSAVFGLNVRFWHKADI